VISLFVQGIARGFHDLPSEAPLPLFVLLGWNPICVTYPMIRFICICIWPRGCWHPRAEGDVPGYCCVPMRLIELDDTREAGVSAMFFALISMESRFIILICRTEEFCLLGYNTV
jgi:hypothetical protein